MTENRDRRLGLLILVVRGPDVLWGGDIRRFHPPVSPTIEYTDSATSGSPSATREECLIADHRHSPRGRARPCEAGATDQGRCCERLETSTCPPRDEFAEPGAHVALKGAVGPLAVELAADSLQVGGDVVDATATTIYWASLGAGLLTEDVEVIHASIVRHVGQGCKPFGVPLPMGRVIARAVKRAMGYVEAVA